MKTIMSVIVSLAITLAFAQAQSLRLLPGDATIAPAAGDQTAPAIAQGGNVLLAVWSDTRANVTGGYEGETSRDIYGVRLDANGNLLDAVPIAITAARATQDNPKVVWNGSNWLVVFESYDLGGTGYYYQKSLAAVRVAPSGQVLDAKPIPLYGLMASGSSYWTAASDGVNWVVVNQGNSTSSDMVAVRISPDGVVLDPPTRVLVQATYYGRFDLKLAYAGGVFALTYSDEYVNGNNNTKLVRFDSNLAKLDAAPLTLLDVTLSDLAANGTSFYIVWNRQEVNGSVHVAGSRVSTAGVKLDGGGVNLSGTKEPGYGSVTTVAWDGVNWRVTWSDIPTFWIARVNDAGVVLDPGSVAVAGVQTGPTAGNGTGGLQVVWTEFINSNYEVFAANISPGNVGGPMRTLSVGAPQQTRPDIATSGNGYMMVYRSATSTAGRVLAQPLDAAGNPLTAEPVQLDSGLNINGPGNPNVAWNGSLYLVSWSAPNGIVAQRLSATGVKLDAAPFMVMSGCFGSADVAALGSDFLVTGLKVGINIQYISPVAARISGAGVVLDAAPLFLGTSYVGRAPAVVALGGRWLAAWHRNATHDNPSCNSMGAFIAAVGTVTPEFQIHGPFSTAGGNGIFEVGLASNGNTALFVQSQELTSGVENDLLCHVVDATGTVGPQINLTPWSGNQYRPRVGWDGTHFVITYQDQKNSLAEQSLVQLDARSDLFGMRVTSTGAIVDPQGFLFSALPTGETDPNVVSLNGVTMLAGSVVLNDSTFANYRIIYEQRDATLNKWPVAVATAAPTGGDVPLTVSFSSAGSGDLDGTIAGYFWDLGDGTTSTAANPTHLYTLPGPFVATLTVTDNGGATATQTVLVKAVAPNQLPVAVASAVPMSGPPPLDVIFYADGSYDPDGFLGNLQWTFSDGGSYWGSPAYYTFYSAGTYTATLTVYDSRGATGTTSLTVYVGTQPPPSPTPTPMATATPTATPSVSPTPVPSPSPTATATVTPTATPTATETATATPGATQTPIVTPTPISGHGPRAINLSTRMRVQTGDNIGIGGFIVTGTISKRVLIRAIGPSLTGFGVPDALADPVLELHGPGTFVTITNDNWRQTQEPEIQATGIPPTNDLESAILVTLTPGPYTAMVKGNGGASGVALVEVYDLDQSDDSKLANLSTRAFVSSGADIVIAGFMLGGDNGDDRIVVRGIGPSLTTVGISNVLANPMLELRDRNGGLLASNNDWQDDPVQAADLTSANLAPPNQQESAIAVTLPAGLYTALLTGMNGGTGVGIVEVYDRGAVP